MEDREYLDPGVISRLEKLGAGFPRKLITLFLEHTPRRLDSALAGGRAGDWKVVEDAAHSLKSSAGNLGAVRLRELADRVEMTAAEGRATGRMESLEALLAELEAAYARTRDLLIAIRDGKSP
jgi:HPt (histidine-containing phosphotransfer) domain-containing protein